MMIYYVYTRGACVKYSFFALRCVVVVAVAMLSKRKRPEDPDDYAAEERVALNVTDLFGGGQISASRSHALTEDMARAGVPPELLPVTLGGSEKCHARRWRRACLKGRQWPDLYWAKVWIKVKGREVEDWVAMLLPHELLEMIMRLGVLAVVGSTINLDPKSKMHLEAVRVESGLGDSLHAMGLHGDGVPCNWDRSETAEVMSINLPGVAAPWNTMRIPISSLPKSQMGPRTWDGLLKIVAWSLRCAYHNIHPTSRHDQSEWLVGTRSVHTDSKRRKKAGTPLGCRFVVCEMRGDWEFFGNALHMPKWSENGGICWDCTCTKDQVTHACIYI